MLSRYLGRPPEELGFSYNEYGKPQIVSAGSDAEPLHFNLAHSKGLALYAFTRLGEIGVDIEYIRPGFPDEEIARRFFSATEVANLNQLPVDDRQKGFFNCWARKEAFIKAKGLGLSLGLDQFDVSLDATQPAALLRTGWDASEAAEWSLREIETESGYAAAVAVRAHDWELKFRRLENDRLLR
jgi:4'-phosphopantetheinyl transferase